MAENSCRESVNSVKIISKHGDFISSDRTRFLSIQRMRINNTFLSPISVCVLLVISIGILPPVVFSTLTMSKDCGDIVCQPHNYCSQVDHSCRPCQIACDPALGNYDKAICEKDCQDYLHDLWYMRKPENESDLQLRDEVYVDLYYRMQEDLRLLKILIGVVIILSTVVMLALFGIMIYFKRLRNKLQQQALRGGSYDMKKSNKKKLGDYPVIYSNSKVLSLPLPDINNRGPPSNISSSVSINNNISRGSSPDLVSRTVTLGSYNVDLSYPSKHNYKGHGDKNSKVTMTSAQDKQSKLRKEPSESTLPGYHAYDNPALVPSPVHIHM